MEVHKVTFIVVDHDGLGAEGVKAEVENVRYPNYCITPLDAVVETREIGEWRDDHPLNRSFAGEVARLFPAITRDDLIRLVVEAVNECADLPINEEHASTIVDEWLGVR